MNITTAIRTNNPRPSRTNFDNWLKTFDPELHHLSEQENLWFLYVVAWCNGVTEEREHHEKLFAQIPTQDPALAGHG